MPAIHAVQTTGCAPIDLAWRQMTEDLAVALIGSGESLPSNLLRRQGRAHYPKLANWLSRHAHSDGATAFFEGVPRRYRHYMRPVDDPAKSIATGILDDEAYDWFVITRGMIRTGGWPVIVTESELATARDDANNIARVPAGATGAAGLAGVQAARKRHRKELSGATAVLLTGRSRQAKLFYP